MYVTRLLFLILIYIVSVNGEDLNCPPSTSKTTHARLKNSILCDYDPTIRPVVNHQNVTALSIGLILMYFTYDISTSTLGINAWMKMIWTDQHLTWNPNDYESMDSIILDTYEIWTPDFSVFNRAVQGGDPTILAENIKCEITSKGLVTCKPSIHIDALCVPDLRMYPFDTQSCVLTMGSWIHKGEELDLNLPKGAVYLGVLEDNGEWNITSYKQKKYKGHYGNVTYPSIEITFNIERLAGAHVASVIIPSIVTILITITTLCMSPTNNDRLILCYVNLVVQFMHVEYMSWQVPLKGDQVPYLFLFARDSLLLSAFAVLFTIGFKKLMNQESPPPEWIRSIAAIAVATPPGQYIFLADYSVKGVASAEGEEDSAGIIDQKQNKIEDWKIFAKILDILLLWAYGIAYLVMSLKLIP